MDGPAGGTGTGQSLLELGTSEHQKAQEGPALSFYQRPSLGPQVPARAQTEPWCLRPRTLDPSLLELSLPSGPWGRAVPKAGVAGALSTGAARPASSLALPVSLNYLPWARGSSSSAGAASASQLRSRRWRSWPLPLAPGPLSDHVTLLQSPCPNFRTPSECCAATLPSEI